MIKIISATVKDIPTIQYLSSIVWPETFSTILSPKQIEYMMTMMYSTQSLTRQIEVDNHHYLLVKEDDKYLGYLSYEINIDNTYTKIHKIYVLPTLQGKGIGKFLIEYVIKKAVVASNHDLRLNVNRYNNALSFYLKIGFSIVSTENIDIGNNFIMEDYVMEMKLEN